MKKANEITVPRLKTNQGLLGPEWLGCINSGRRPLIYKTINKTYLVGYQFDVERCRENYLWITEPGRKLQYKSRGKGKKRTEICHTPVWHLKGRAAAIKKFHEMSQVVMDSNGRELEASLKDLDTLKKATIHSAVGMEAALNLGDRGLL